MWYHTNERDSILAIKVILSSRYSEQHCTSGIIVIASRCKKYTIILFNKQWVDHYSLSEISWSLVSAGLMLRLFSISEIWQAPRQQCCWDACQITERCHHYNIQSRGFETSWDLAVRRLNVNRGLIMSCALSRTLYNVESCRRTWCMHTRFLVQIIFGMECSRLYSQLLISIYNMNLSVCLLLIPVRRYFIW